MWSARSDAALFATEARDELTEAERYYDEWLPGLGTRFATKCE